MIKCPECGSPVSTMAGTCPQCGVKIMGNLIQCSQCGTHYLNTESCCPYCDHIEEMGDTETPDASEHQQTEPTFQDNPDGKKKKTSIWKWGIALVCTSLLACGIYTGYQYYTDYTYRMEEKKRFEELALLTNPEFYHQYLADYPESIYRPEVEKRLQELADESDAWAKALQNGQKDALRQFIETYPGSLHSRKCLQLIDSIDWTEAQIEGTEEAANAYLDAHPEGMYTSEAVELKKRLEQSKTSVEENESIDRAIHEFFSATLTEGGKTEISEAIAEPMQSFCGTPKATAQHIIKFIKGRKEKNVATLKFIINAPITKSRTKLYDNTTGYRAECLVEEIITRTSGKQKVTEKQHTATCLLDGRFRMVMIDIKENE